MTQLETAVQAVGSALKVAEKVHRLLGRQDGENWPEPRAIGNKLSKLLKGDQTWWRSRSRAVEALATVLNLTPEQILPEQALRGPFVLADFPELRALGALDGMARVSPDGWLGETILRTDASPKRWIVAAPGMGKHLAVRWLLRFQDSIEALEVNRLAEVAAGPPSDRRVVISVAEPDAEGDELALAASALRHSQVTVMAPFVPPMLAESWRLEGFGLAHGWQAQLVDWVRGRLPTPERLPTPRVLEALARLDPDERYLVSPGDLMPLLRRFYLTGIPKAPVLASLAREWTRARFASEPHWIGKHGLDGVRALVRRRFEEPACAVIPLPLDVWSELLPAELTAKRTADEIAAEVRRLRKAKSAPDADEVEHLVELGPRDALERLARARLMRPFGSGFDVFPRWIGAGFAEERVAESLAARDDLQWALWGVEVTRRPTVDRALDLLTLPELARWTSLAMDRVDDRLEVIGAIESLFSAWGRRALTQPSSLKPHTQMLQSLGMRQAELLALAPEVSSRISLVPITRSFPPEWVRHRTDSYAATWLAEAWAFSSAVASPRDDYVGWELAGWSRQLDLVKADLPGDGLDFERPPWSHLARLGRQLVPRCTAKSEWHAFGVRVLMPWLLLDGLKADDARPETVLAEACGAFSDRDDKSIEIVREHGTEAQHPAVASSLFGFLLRRHGLPWRALTHREVPAEVAAYVADHLPGEEFQRALERVTRSTIAQYDEEAVEGLPRRFARPTLRLFLRWQIEQGRALGKAAEGLVSTLERDDFDLIVRVAGVPYQIGDTAARLGWALDRELAWAEIDARLASEDCPGSWFTTASEDELAALLDRLDVYRGRPLKWVDRFLVGALATAGSLAPRVFAMIMERAGARSSGTLTNR